MLESLSNWSPYQCLADLGLCVINKILAQFSVLAAINKTFGCDYIYGSSTNFKADMKTYLYANNSEPSFL